MEYLTDREANEATGFIQKAVKQNKSFFLYMAHYAVHTPIQAKEVLTEYYQNKLELYNLKDEISEKNNLLEKNPGKVIELQKKLDKWLTDLK